MGHYIKVTELPPSLQRALVSAGYNRKDIEVKVTEEFEPRPPSADGRRGFVAMCLLDDSNEFKLTWGSFGGANMFTTTVDDVKGAVEIPQNVAYITGMSNAGSGYPGFATVFVGPKNMNPTLLPSAPSVTEREGKLLAIYKTLKSSYRKEYLDRAKTTPEEIDSLVARGFLSRNKAGAISITTEGRNAAAKDYY